MKEIKEHKIQDIEVEKIQTDGENPNIVPDDVMEALRYSMEKYGFLTPIIVDQDFIVADGEHRLQIYKEFDRKTIPCYVVQLNTAGERKLLRQVMNKVRGEHDPHLDAKEFERILKDLDMGEVTNLLAIDEEDIDLLLTQLSQNFKDAGLGNAGSLKEDYIMPPFSVLDTRQGDWLERKRAWFNLLDFRELASTRKTVSIIKKTREDSLGKSVKAKGSWGTQQGDAMHIAPNVSIFDPVLAEIMYLWFCPKDGVVLDPFAGGTRSIVSAVKGYNFKGMEIRQEQIDVYEKVLTRLNCSEKVQFFCDDAINLDQHIKEESVDLLFSCPPYYDLEKYSVLPGDLSNMSEEDFDRKHREIIRKAVKTLKPNRFAVWVIGEVRRKKEDGAYRHFIPKVIKCFKEAGLKYYNEIILINQVGTLPIRIRKTWEATHKVGKMHQNVLVFYKGDNVKENKFWGDTNAK